MKPSPELIQLVDQCLSGEISQAEMTRLEELLSDDDALRYYLDIVRVEGDIPLALDSEPVGDMSSSPASNVIIPSAFPRWIKPLSLAAAAVVLFSFGFFMGNKPASSNQNLTDTSIQNNSTSSSSAVITSLVGVTWDGDAPDSLNLGKHSKAIAIESGLVELTFASGVKSLIEGPAVIHITGDNSAQLDNGRLVADVPKGAEGFTVNYPEGKVIDLGTEFAMNVPIDQKGAEVGVFRGEVEVYDKHQNKPLKIIENHAVTQVSGAEHPFTSIPFQRENYIRTLPTREFSWQLSKEISASPDVFEYDVSHLVWKSGDYRAVIKWMKGNDALIINRVGDGF